jgi:hypothetical protein
VTFQAVRERLRPGSRPPGDKPATGQADSDADGPKPALG